MFSEEYSLLELTQAKILSWCTICKRFTIESNKWNNTLFTVSKCTPQNSSCKTTHLLMWLLQIQINNLGQNRKKTHLNTYYTQHIIVIVTNSFSNSNVSNSFIENDYNSILYNQCKGQNNWSFISRIRNSLKRREMTVRSNFNHGTSADIGQECIWFCLSISLSLSRYQNKTIFHKVCLFIFNIPVTSVNTLYNN